VRPAASTFDPGGYPLALRLKWRRGKKTRHVAVPADVAAQLLAAGLAEPDEA
jgi:hypothetical protein